MPLAGGRDLAVQRAAELAGRQLTEHLHPTALRPPEPVEIRRRPQSDGLRRTGATPRRRFQPVRALE